MNLSICEAFELSGGDYANLRWMKEKVVAGRHRSLCRATSECECWQAML